MHTIALKISTFLAFATITLTAQTTSVGFTGGITKGIATAEISNAGLLQTSISPLLGIEARIEPEGWTISDHQLAIVSSLSAIKQRGVFIDRDAIRTGQVGAGLSNEALLESYHALLRIGLEVSLLDLSLDGDGHNHFLLSGGTGFSLEAGDTEQSLDINSLNTTGYSIFQDNRILYELD